MSDNWGVAINIKLIKNEKGVSMNYDLKMEEQINNMEGKVKTLLLHACCAPCSSACLERLGNNFKISIFIIILI